MAITATVDLGNGISKAGCYIIIPTARVSKIDNADGGDVALFKLIYDAVIYQNASERVGSLRTKRIYCRTVDHHKTSYDVGASDNPFVLAYTHLKTNGSLSSIADV